MNDRHYAEGGMNPQQPSGGRLPANVMHFARLLRRAGLRVGPGHIATALAALSRVDVRDRDQLYWALHAVMVSHQRDHELFDQAFALFWRDPGGMMSALGALLPKVQTPKRKTASRRVSEAMHPPKTRPDPPPPKTEADAALAFSATERLQERDFAEMSADELAQARRIIAQMKLRLRPVPTRRYRSDARGAHVDMRATLRAQARSGPNIPVLKRRTMAKRPPALVVLCDISGSMERYAEILLCFVHTLASHRERVHGFVFGTRLSNITRLLRHRDIDVALAAVGRTVSDWSGGTRIGACLADFNRHWSRRVLAQGAVILLISDGLDRDAGRGLSAEMERMHKSCRRLIWLNPLLSYRDFAPRASGIRAMLPHVDDFRPVHNLQSLAQLADALSGDAARRDLRQL